MRIVLYTNVLVSAVFFGGVPSPLERLALAQQLGREAVAMFARAHGVTADEARREFERRRQRGRRPSRCSAEA